MLSKYCTLITLKVVGDGVWLTYVLYRSRCQAVQVVL
jgi:hypothetical protein